MVVALTTILLLIALGLAGYAAIRRDVVILAVALAVTVLAVLIEGSDLRIN